MAEKDADGSVELTATEARRGSRRLLNLRVLLTSPVRLIAIGVGLYAAFWSDPALKGRETGDGATTQPQTRP